MLGLEASVCYVGGVMPREPTDPLKGSPPPPFIDTRRDGYMYRGLRKSSFLPEPWGYNSRVLWEVNCGVWCRAWWSSLSSRRLRRRPASPSRRRGPCYRVYGLPNVAQWRSVGPASQSLACTSGSGARGSPGPPGRSAGLHTRRSGRNGEVPDPSRGEVRDSGCECRASLFGGTW